MSIGDRRVGSLRHPLMRARRAFGQLPFVFEQIFEKVVAPLRWRGRPGDFQAARNRVPAAASTEAVPPAEALLFETCSFRLRRNVRRWSSTVRLAKRVTTGDQGYGFLVVH